MRKFHEKLGILKYLLPTYYGILIFDYAKEIDNLMFFRTQLKKVDEEGLALRKNWNITNDGKLVFAVNLIPENLLVMDKQQLEEYEKLSLSNEVLKVQNELVPYQLYDITKFKFERILDFTEGYYGFGVTGIFRYRKITTSNTVYLSVYTLCIIGIVLLFVL